MIKIQQTIHVESALYNVWLLQMKPICSEQPEQIMYSFPANSNCQLFYWSLGYIDKAI